MAYILELFIEPFCVRSDVAVIGIDEAMSDRTSSDGTLTSMDSTQLPADAFSFSSVSLSAATAVLEARKL